MLLNAAIEAAIDLNDPYEGNREYARGQTELICDMFGLLQEAKYEIFRKITNGADLEATISDSIDDQPRDRGEARKHVYVITRYVEYEGENVLGIAKTPRAAKKFAATKFEPDKFEPDSGKGKPYWRGSYRTILRADEPWGSELLIERIEVIE